MPAVPHEMLPDQYERELFGIVFCNSGIHPGRHS
jgi:hypothetical protein